MCVTFFKSEIKHNIETSSNNGYSILLIKNLKLCVVYIEYPQCLHELGRQQTRQFESQAVKCCLREITRNKIVCNTFMQNKCFSFYYI